MHLVAVKGQSEPLSGDVCSVNTRITCSRRIMSRRDRVGRTYRVNEGAGAAGKRLAPGDDTPGGHMAAGGAVSRGNYRGGRLEETHTHKHTHTVRQEYPDNTYMNISNKWTTAPLSTSVTVFKYKLFRTSGSR